MIFPIAELLTATAVGVLDGWAASTDQNASRTSLTNERSTWVKAGAFLAGAALDFMGWNEAVTETLMATSLALLARQLTFRAAQGSGGAVAQGFARSNAYAAYVQPAGPTLALPTSAGMARGFSRMTSVGAVG